MPAGGGVSAIRPNHPATVPRGERVATARQQSSGADCARANRRGVLHLRATEADNPAILGLVRGSHAAAPH
jgi:hypothetical protein